MAANIIWNKTKKKWWCKYKQQHSNGGFEQGVSGIRGGKIGKTQMVGRNPCFSSGWSPHFLQTPFSLLKLGARQVLISTAEKKNIPWREMRAEILESDVYKLMDSIQDPSIIYPDYYLNPFHAYDGGNLSWLAVAEAEAATMSMMRRTIPDASSLDEANQIVRGNWLQAIDQHHKQYSGNIMIGDILDVGCSVGVSTRYLADTCP